jgi:hypothetical protein
MQKTLNLPAYHELTELTDDELIKYVQVALDQVQKAKENHENTTEIMMNYMAYQNEVVRRNHRAHLRLMF